MTNNLTWQVSSLEWSKKLKELGVKQGSLFYWENTVGQPDQTVWKVIPVERCNFEDQWLEYYSAFSVAELGSLLPKNENLVLMLFENGHCQMCIQASDDFRISLGSKGMVEADTEADARAEILIYLIENKLINP